MGRTLAKYSAVLIGLYIVVAAGSNGGTLIENATAGTARVINAFQGTQWNKK